MTTNAPWGYPAECVGFSTSCDKFQRNVITLTGVVSIPTPGGGHPHR